MSTSTIACPVDPSNEVATESQPTSDFPASPLHLMYGSPDEDIAWILIGVKQSQAAADTEPDDVVIYCADERTVYNAAARPDGLAAIEGKRVVIFPKGDAAADHRVFDRSTKFGRFCEDEGATEVTFAWLGADLDEHLGDRDLDARRKRLANVLQRIGKKPAKAKPPAPSATQQNIDVKRAELELAAVAQGRPVIDVNADRRLVLGQLTKAMQDGPYGDRLYNLGGQLVCTTRNDRGALVAEALDEERLLNVLAESAQMISATSRGISSAWPESKTIAALYGRPLAFRTLSRIAPSPIVRSDHTVATQPGYDETSQVLLDTDDLQLDVPDDPTEDEVEAAVELLIGTWLGDFPFASQADKANTLALILTFPLRELAAQLPLAYIVAKSQGTGKSKLASLIVYLFTGTYPELDSLPENEDEVRKQITTLLSAAPQAILFDESPEIGGRSINRLVTASRWSDRILGGNQRASLPNKAVLMATANNGQAVGDTRRRYYPVELYFDGENPENRPESDFQHPDIEAWTEEHRGELLSAVFTLIRAWQVAGRPKRATSFGSFERWEAVVGGVLHNAKVPGFLGNLSTHRKTADYDEGLWVAHLRWLESVFPSGLFTVSDVVISMVTRSGKVPQVHPHADLPPGIDTSPTDSSYGAKLGRLYHARQGRMADGYRITATPNKTGNKTIWQLELSERLVAARAEAKAAEKAAERAAMPSLEETEEQLRLVKAELARMSSRASGTTAPTEATQESAA